ncbi:MAG TPA: ABC transporter permease [Gammaproteobacteria bacterium]|nr:ABC transporter permease [Gammaproteobacteria bacterium]
MKNTHIEKDAITTIKPDNGWEPIDFKELIRYRDLAYFLVWRDISVQFAQTILGFSWAILQPLIQIIIFSIIFGRIAQIPSDGIPYLLFSTTAVIPWTYMSSVMSQSSESLVSNQDMLGKVYVPRLLYPLTPVLSKLMDFSISLFLLIAIMFYYKVTPTWNLIYLPLFIVMMMTFPIAVGMWLSSLAIRYRDVRFAMQYVIQMLMYTAPIVYTASSIPDEYRFYYSLNPLVGVIEGFRATLLGTDIPWMFVLPGIFSTVVLLVGGAFYFKRMERIVVDVI